MTKNKRKRIVGVDDLADEVFELVQSAQGRGFVCDGLGGCRSKEEFFDIIRNHLFFSRVAVRQLEQFLNKHKQPTFKYRPTENSPTKDDTSSNPPSPKTAPSSPS